MNEETNLLMIGDTKYHLSRALTVGATGPKITISASELNTDGDISSEHKAHIVTDKPFADTGPVILYKQNGKYTIIFGKNNVKDIHDDKVIGHLVSHVALKKAKVQDAVEINPVQHNGGFRTNNFRDRRSTGWPTRT